jgi:predicted nicotinamide N-methyase
LGRFDIITEVSMLLTHLCFPHEGHLAVFHVFAYLQLHHNAIVVFDPTYPSVDMGTFINTDWKSRFGVVNEMIPSDAPVHRVKEVYLHLFVNSDHSGEQFTRR